MNALRFYATCAITLILLTLCVILAQPTYLLMAGFSGEGMGPGVLPAISLSGTGILSVYIFVAELRRFRQTRATPEDPRQAVNTLGLPVRPFLIRSGIALALLWAYIALWQVATFVPATMAFAIGLGFVALKPEERTKKRLVFLVVSLMIVTVVIWFSFAYLLGVGLR